MKNVILEVKGDKLVLTIDLKSQTERSASGKSLVIASTQGNKSLPSPNAEIFVGLNVYKKA